MTKKNLIPWQARILFPIQLLDPSKLRQIDELYHFKDDLTNEVVRRNGKWGLHIELKTPLAGDKWGLKEEWFLEFPNAESKALLEQIEGLNEDSTELVKQVKESEAERQEKYKAAIELIKQVEKDKKKKKKSPAKKKAA